MRDDRYAFLRNLDLFADQSHEPFTWEAPRDGSPLRGAALLLHGFPGTPADLRPMAGALNEAGWAVYAPLLPGFGRQIATLPTRRYTEWIMAARDGLVDLRARHERVVLVGHSMGAAIGLVASAAEPPDAQVLLAPFWRFGGSARNVLWPVLRVVFRRWRPLKSANFDDDQIRQGIFRFLPDVDLDDEGVRTELRDFVVPISVLDELRKLAGATRRAAGLVTAPTLVVQGLRDGLVRPADVDVLMRRLPGGTRLELVDATHKITDPDDGAWERVRRTVLEFVAEVP